MTYKSGRLWRVDTLFTIVIYIQLSICVGPGWYAVKTMTVLYILSCLIILIFFANITVLNYTGISVV